MTTAGTAPVHLASIRGWIAPFAARPIALIGIAVLIVVVVAAIAAPLLAPYDPTAYDALIRLSPPNPGHWFGTDQFGRDTLSRVIYSARMALLVGVGVVVFALVTGVPVGYLSVETR